MSRPRDRNPRRSADPPTADYRAKRRETDSDAGALELTTPFGFSGKMSSSNFLSTVTLLGLLAAISIIGYFVWDSQVKGFTTLNQTLQVQTGIITQYSSDLRESRNHVTKEHEAIARAFSDVAYIISVPQDKRERLGLEEPPGLRRRLQGE
ncbi:MAG TPA: hypothetical protein VLK35_01895 [Methylomirabilota bacterium]|nr:hypothetical protein [Methylomirabilota bacterium]